MSLCLSRCECCAVLCCAVLCCVVWRVTDRVATRSSHRFNQPLLAAGSHRGEGPVRTLLRKQVDRHFQLAEQLDDDVDEAETDARQHADSVQYR